VLVPDRSHTAIEEMDVFAQHLVLYERNRGQPQIRVAALSSLDRAIEFTTIPLPSSVGVISPGANVDFEATSVRFSFQSPNTPPSDFSYDMTTGQLELLRTAHVPGSPTHASSSEFDAILKVLATKHSAKASANPTTVLNDTIARDNKVDRVSLARVVVPFAPGHPGPALEDPPGVPMTLVTLEAPGVDGRTDQTLEAIAAKGPRPTLLLAYGAYGVTLETEFSIPHLTLLQRGWWGLLSFGIAIPCFLPLFRSTCLLLCLF
jgi:hypothetical protein